MSPAREVKAGGKKEMESSCSDLGKWDSGREMNVIKKKQRYTIGQQEYKVYCKWGKQEGG